MTTANITALGSDQYVAATAVAAAEWAESIRASIRSDWDTTVEAVPTDTEKLGVGVYHRPSRLIVRASGDFARGAFPVRDQGRAQFSAVIWIGGKPSFIQGNEAQS